MERYIKCQTALKIIDSYGRTVTEDGKVVVAAIRDIVEVITPTADVAPKNETANEIAEWLDDEISKMPCYDREFELYVKLTIEQLKKKYAEDKK